MTKLGETDPTQHPPKVTRNERAQATRSQILQIAKRHFARSGYRGATTAAIAAEAGITDPGLLHHFHSKRGLLQALLDDRYGDDESTFTFDPDGEPFALLVDIVQENQSNRADVLLYAVLLAESLDTDQASHDWFTDRFNRVRTSVAESLQRAQDQGSIRRDLDVAGVAAVIVAAMDGLQYQWLLDPTLDMADAFRSLCTALQTTLTTE